MGYATRSNALKRPASQDDLQSVSRRRTESQIELSYPTDSSRSRSFGRGDSEISGDSDGDDEKDECSQHSSRSDYSRTRAHDSNDSSEDETEDSFGSDSSSEVPLLDLHTAKSFSEPRLGLSGTPSIREYRKPLQCSDFADEGQTYEDVTMVNRDRRLGRVWVLVKGRHPLVKSERVGKVYVILLDFSREAMVEMHDFCATLKNPSTEEEQDAMGFFRPSPEDNDMIYMRDIYGEPNSKADKLKSNALSRHDYSAQELKDLRALRSDLIGDEHSEGKGGIRLEKNLQNLKGSDRAYPLGVSNQTIRQLEGPAINSKQSSFKLDEGGMLQKRLLHAGATCGIKMFDKVDTDMRDIMRDQGELTNCPRLGCYENVYWTSAQVNVASLRWSDVVQERAIQGGKGKEKETDKNIKDIGQFGGPHHDGGDNEAGLTNMMNWTAPHPHVKKEYFTIIDLGCCWRLDELCSIFFSGLHYHCGSAAHATDEFDGTNPYTRITLIMYPSGHELDGDSKVAFAGIDADTRHGLLTITSAMRNTRRHEFNSSPTCKSGNYVADGGAFMDDRSYLSNVSRNNLLLTDYIVRQAPPGYLLRIDREKLLSSFSMVIDGKRVQADDWQMGPGWTGDDVEIGKTYEGLDEAGDKELKLWVNTDAKTDVPYGNQAILDQQTKWKEYKQKQMESYPVCHAANEIGVEELGYNHRRQLRGVARKNVRNGKKPKTKVGQSKKRRNKLNAGRKKNTKSKKTVQEKTIFTVGTRIDGDFPVFTVGTRKDECPPLFKALLPEALNKELLTVTYDHLLAQDSFNPPEAFSLYRLARIYNSADHHGGSDAALIRALHQEQLLVNLLIWERLAALKAQALDVLKATEPLDVIPSEWFVRLSRAMHSWLLTQTDTVYFAHDYLPDAFSANQPVTFELSKRSALEFPDNLSESAVLKAEKAVLHWLGVPGDEKDRRAALLTRLLIDGLGVEVLAVDEVWNSCQKLAKRVLGQNNAVLPSSQALVEEVEKQLERLEEKSDEITLILSRISEQCSAARAGSSRVYFGIIKKAALVPVVFPLFVRSSATLPFRTPTPPSPSPSSTEFPGDYHKFAAWLDQIHLCLLLFKEDRVCELPPLVEDDDREKAIHKFPKEVMAYPDKRFPFREHAPSRFRVLHYPEGPFSDKFIHTRSGFFSVLVARGITHSTEFLQNWPVMFQSLEDFEKVVDQATTSTGQDRKSEYFCKAGAYGRSIKDRSIDNVAKYWESSGKHFGLLANGNKTGFMELVKTLCGSDFPTIGKLVALQIAIDYAKTRVIVSTWEDFVEAMRWVNMGAIAGLGRLGLLGDSEQPKGSKKMISPIITVPAFNNVREWVAKSWNSDECEWDMYDLEHWLCKTSSNRLGRNSYYSIPVADGM